MVTEKPALFNAEKDHDLQSSPARRLETSENQERDWMSILRGTKSSSHSQSFGTMTSSDEAPGVDATAFPIEHAATRNERETRTMVNVDRNGYRNGALVAKEDSRKQATSRQVGDRSFEARFGKKLGRNITPIPEALLRYRGELGLGPEQIDLIVDVLSHKWDERCPFPSVGRLAKRAGVNASTIKRRRKKLVGMGLLILESRLPKVDGTPRSPLWDFSPLFRILGGLIDRDKDTECPENREPRDDDDI